MKGEAKVIEYLNAALRSELTAVSQYWLHFRLQEDWGFGHLADKSRAESIEEMHHADKLIARIIFLEGHPNLQKLDSLRIGQTVRETLESDLAAEHDAFDVPVVDHEQSPTRQQQEIDVQLPAVAVRNQHVAQGRRRHGFKGPDELPARARRLRALARVASSGA